MKTAKEQLSFLFIFLFIIQFLSNIQCIEQTSTALTLVAPNLFRDRQNAEPAKFDFSDIWKSIKFDNECHIDVDIEWEASLGGYTLSTPIIGDFRNDGRKEIILATYGEYVEAIDGEDGEKEPGWPFILPEAKFVGGVIDYDFQGDGARDLVVTTSNAEILFLSEAGLPYIGTTLKVPRLGVEKDWFANIDSKYVYFALYTRLPSLEERKLEEKERQETIYNKLSQFMAMDDKLANERFKVLYKRAFEQHIFDQKQKFEKFQQVEVESEKHNNKLNNNNNKLGGGMRKLFAFINDDDDDDLEDERGEREFLDESLSGFQGMQGWLTNDGVESLDLFLPTEASTSFITQLRYQINPLFSPQYDQYVKKITPKEDPNLVYLDAHISGTPIITDLDHDGRMELIASVNYFFTRGSERFKQYNVDATKYMACGVVVFDLTIHQIKWISPLDLSTETQRLRASISGTPTIADIDGDGFLDIIVASSVGHIYALNRFGTLLSGYPLVMSAIFAPIVVEDIDEDGKLDLIAIDSTSSVAVYNGDGKLKWERQISMGINSPPSIGDIDGDGDLDLAIVSPLGHLWILDGKTGTNVKNFPGNFDKGSGNSPTLIRMKDNKHLHIIFQSIEGHLYIIDGKTACVETVDLGQRGNAMILADDVTGNGKLDLISTGLNRITCLATDTPFHPLNIWEGYNGRRGSTMWRQGAFFSLPMREMRDITGDSFTVQFEIFDERKTPARHARSYSIRMFLRKDMEPYFNETYYEPGVYTVTLPAPNLRFTGTLHLEMTNELTQYFEDSLSLSFNAKFYRSIKWMILVPFTLAVFVVLFFRDIQRAVSLV